MRSLRGRILLSDTRIRIVFSAFDDTARPGGGMKGRVLLIAGVPGVGKTTVVRNVKGLLAGERIRG